MAYPTECLNLADRNEHIDQPLQIGYRSGFVTPSGVGILFNLSR